MNEIIFRANDVSKKYKNNIALEDVNIEIKRGQIYGFIGHNGAGKTTLIRILTGLARPTGGEIELFGKKGERELARERQRIGCIIEAPAICPDMTAWQNLEVQRIQRGIPGRKSVDEVLALVGLTDTGRKKAKDFSLGMRQRLALGIALLGEPEFLILDEPTNGLDPMGIVEIRELLKRINIEKEITILVSSHLLSELHLLATHYGIIHKGKMVQQISAKELEDKCRRYVRIESDNSELAVTIIENELKTKSYEVSPDNVIRLFEYTESPITVSNALFKGGVGIKSIYIQGDNLESYYTSLIGGAVHA
ncbi:MAG: ATP-binding cassette domain-containing protein [Clostridia bacterium]|nr:ATP-binding cassette domain-containing protein [Clostridia bacterium]